MLSGMPLVCPPPQNRYTVLPASPAGTCQRSALSRPLLTSVKLAADVLPVASSLPAACVALLDTASVSCTPPRTSTKS